MKDIPMFTTDYGVATLILKEIPYRGIAYVRIQDMQPGMIREMIGECVTFCRMAGAERVFAAGNGELKCYPYHNSVVSMSGPADFQSEANLFPVTQETVSDWRRIYNQRMKGIDNAATMTRADENRICGENVYFVHRDGKLLGIGWVEEGRLLSVASTHPGAGACVVKTLLSAQSCRQAELEVASNNEKAIRLYESLGYIQTREISRWYRVL